MATGEVYPDWEAVYRDNLDRIYGLMFSKVGNRADAEDLTAEVFLAALGPLRVSASVGEVRAYLLATARTVLAGHWRRHYGREVTAITEGFDPPSPAPWNGDTDRDTDGDTGTGREDAAGVVSRAEELLAGLPEQYQRVLRLRFLRGYSVRDTAEAMGISVGHAKVLQHRALRRAGQSTDEVTR